MITTQEMENFINKDEHTGKAFDKLVKLAVQRNNNLTHEATMREKMLREMVKIGCYKSPEKTGVFITGHYQLIKRIRPLFRMARGLKA